MQLLSVVGTRPNIVKIGVLHAAFARYPEIQARILHTGQHYDTRLSDVFFKELGLPEPDTFLGVGGGSQSEQTGRIMMAFEREVERERPDIVVVVGDVNSTLACALVCAKLQIPLAHVEAGLRSGDRTMPEEVNRLVTDTLSDFLFVTEQSGLDHLRREGVAEEKLFFTGNVMIDALLRFKDQAAGRQVAVRRGLPPGRYVLMTMHRPATVDHPAHLEHLATVVEALADEAPVVFPVHPRTHNNLMAAGLLGRLSGRPRLHLMPPLSYLDFLSLMMQAGVVITDSGGIQEETTFLRVPCITLRPNTERPVTVTLGTNVLLPLDAGRVATAAGEALAGHWKQGTRPPYWDGKASKRIARILIEKVARAAGRTGHLEAAL